MDSKLMPRRDALVKLGGLTASGAALSAAVAEVADGTSSRRQS